jgi:CheY-like chemotaxis protein
VTVRLFEKEIDSKMWVVIEVTDTGIGIEELNLGIIFDEFRQVSEGISRNYEGVGLGLTLTNKYVNLLGGKITVISKLNEGSVFSVYLPLESNIKNSLSNNSSNKNDDILITPVLELIKYRKNLLIVDDDDISRTYIKTILKKDYNLDITINGKEALEKVNCNQYDAILLDINLGKGESGVHVLKEIRKIHCNDNIPIIAITAYAMIGDKEKYINEGFTNYISKPFYKNELIELLTLYNII